MNKKLIDEPCMQEPLAKRIFSTIVTCLFVLNASTCSADSNISSQLSTPVIVKIMDESQSKSLFPEFVSPISPRAIVENINTIMKKPSSIDARFLDENNLKRFLGNLSYKIVEDKTDSKYVEIAGINPQFGEQVSCIKDGILSWRKFTDSEGKSSTAFIMAIGIKDGDQQCKDFSADTVRSIFGEPSKVSDIFGGNPPPHGRNVRYGPKTHPMGSSDISYSLLDAGIDSSLSFSTLGDGVIYSLKLSIMGGN